LTIAVRENITTTTVRLLPYTSVCQPFCCKGTKVCVAHGTLTIAITAWNCGCAFCPGGECGLVRWNPWHPSIRGTPVEKHCPTQSKLMVKSRTAATRTLSNSKRPTVNDFMPTILLLWRGPWKNFWNCVCTEYIVQNCV